MVKAKKIAILIIAMLEMLMFSGVFYGFNSLIPIYKDAGVFSQYCENTEDNGTVTCSTQDTYFGRAFLSWLIVQAITSFILGIILDRFGIIVMKIIASTCFLGGFICLGFTPAINWLLYVGGSLLTMSAHCLGISNISISVIFSGNGNMIVSLYSALFDASSIVMSVIKFLTDFGAPVWVVCSIYGCVGCVVILGSIFFLKSRTEDIISNLNEKDKENPEEIEMTEQNTSSDDTEESEDNSSTVSGLIASYQDSVDEKFPTLKDCFMSPEYLVQLAYFVILCFRFTFYLAQMSSQLTYLFPTQPEVRDHLLSVSNLFFLGSLVIGPMFGVLLDRYQKYTFGKIAQESSLVSGNMYNKINACFFLPSFICSTSMLLASVLLFIPNKHVFYLVFICMTITRALLFAINGAYIFSALPKKHFGTLIGAVFLTTGLINLFQQVLIPFASPDSHPNVVNDIMIGMCAISFGHGLYLRFKK